MPGWLIEFVNRNNSLSLLIKGLHWDTVYTIPKETVLKKGRRGLYHAITAAAGSLPYRFGCYCWRNAEEVWYIGSFSKDNVGGQFDSNLQARVHNYLQNHQTSETGRKNTNLYIFEHINQALASSLVLLSHFRFDSIQTDGDLISLEGFSDNPDLVRTAEQMLLYKFRLRGECKWNRT